MKLKLDLHDIYNRGQDIDRALQAISRAAEDATSPVTVEVAGSRSLFDPENTRVRS